jgi:uncharacterized protein YeaO (DUF488 family)
VVDKTDGTIDTTGNPIIYNIDGGGYSELVTDFSKLKPTMDKFNQLLKNNNLGFNEQSTYELLTKIGDQTEADDDFFLVMSRVLTNKEKKNEFIESIFNTADLTAVTDPVKLYDKFEKIVNKLTNDYENELNAEKKYFKKIKQSNEYSNLTKGITTQMYTKGKSRVLNYNTTPNESIISIQKELITNLYRTTNVNNDRETFNGKITFN